MTKTKCILCDSGQRSSWCMGKCIHAHSEMKHEKTEVVEVEKSDITTRFLICKDTGGAFTTVGMLNAIVPVSYNLIYVAIAKRSAAYGLKWDYIDSDEYLRSNEKIAMTVAYIKLFKECNKSKRVFCNESGILYDNLTDASEKTGIKAKTIASAAGKRCKHAEGYTFEYMPSEYEEKRAEMEAVCQKSKLI